MSEFLVFTLESHMASFGDLAGFERRGTASWPAKSALIGILGASLGVRREDKAALDDLRALSFLVAVYDSGVVLRDFHTSQAVHQKIKQPSTRGIALSKGKKLKALKTVLTKRDYRCGVSFGIAVWGNSVSLDRLSSSLRNPVFVPYLGRKSCPLSAPVGAKVVDALNPVLAVEHVTLPPWRFNDGEGNKPQAETVISDPHPELHPDIVESRYDIPIDRKRWHFESRDVHIITGAN